MDPPYFRQTFAPPGYKNFFHGFGFMSQSGCKNFFAQLGFMSQLVKHKPVQNYLHRTDIPDTVHTAAPAIQHKPQYPFSGHHILCTSCNHTPT